MRRALSLALLACALFLAPARADSPPPVTGWLGYGASPARTSDVPGGAISTASSWFAPLPGRETAQPLAVRDVPRPGDLTVVFATSTGEVDALAPNGYVRWRVQTGQLAHPCPMLAGYGVTGTPVADPASRTLYLVDAFGRMHALDLATGAERPGWPVTLYTDYREEIEWGALALVDGSVYAGTGTYCDQPAVTPLYRVSTTTREVTSWTPVPRNLGGGGGSWGWGGVAYSAARDSLYVATGNAIQENETAGYGERLVELSPSLEVRASSHPADVVRHDDLDFVGSPVLADVPGCGELAAAVNKNGTLYGWRADAVAAGPSWFVRLQAADPAKPLLTQPAWSSALRAYYVVTYSELVRIQVGSDCRPTIAWRLDVKNPTLNGSPTVAGGTVWLELSATPGTLLGVDAATGKVRVRRKVGGIGFPGPTVLDGRLFSGETHGFPAGRVPVVRAGERATRLPEYRSFAGELGWESRESGVYATANGGRTWRRLLPRYAARVVRTSARAGMIASGFPAPACACTTQQLWTGDGGRTWHPTKGVGWQFQGRGPYLYWWAGGTLDRVTPWPGRAGVPLRSRRVTRFAGGTIVAAANVPGGVAALVSNRVGGSGWDNSPRVAVVRNARVRTIRLPSLPGTPLAQSISASWPRITVTGASYPAGSAVTWRSVDGGARWTASAG